MASTAKHTPGPWHSDSVGYISSASEGFIPLRVPFREGVFGPNPDDPLHDQFDVALANARLIAAAPLLLEALEDIATCATPPGHMAQQLDDVFDIARAAIKAATES